jgi:undecaprenyl-diphosphatase
MQQIDESVLFFLNGLNNQFFDGFFWYVTKGIIYLPLYLLAVWFGIKQFGWRALILVAFAGLTFALTDQSCAFIKDAVCRLRPTHDPDIFSLIHTVNNYRGGLYGFPSAHACNTFGMAVFLCGVLRPKRWWFTAAFFVWAALLSYSRIYLGVHYPLDILCGGAMGAFIGWGMAVVFLKITVRINKKGTAGSHPFSKKKHV